MRNRLRFFAQRSFRINGVDLHIGVDHADGRFSLAEPAVFLAHDQAAELPRSPFLTLDADGAQSLMDELYAAGVRPTAGQGSAGQLDAVQRHLADMRAIAAGRLRLELPNP
jgi:hypothetical protein